MIYIIEKELYGGSAVVLEFDKMSIKISEKTEDEQKRFAKTEEEKFSKFFAKINLQTERFLQKEIRIFFAKFKKQEEVFKEELYGKEKLFCSKKKEHAPANALFKRSEEHTSDSSH